MCFAKQKNICSPLSPNYEDVMIRADGIRKLRLVWLSTGALVQRATPVSHSF